jgi:ferredoxin-NADP reductase
VPDWRGHIAGQHVDVRLTAEDGYQTERSYSIASAPEDPVVALTVERIDGGEVSPYLTQELRVGDELELRGPFTSYFVWRTEDGGPLLLIAGGSGLVPLMAMIRHRAARMSTVETRLLLSARSLKDVLYHDELVTMASEGGVGVHYTFTREPPPDWRGFARRIDAEMLKDRRTLSYATTADLRLRSDGVCRASCRSAREARSRAGQHSHGAIRPHGMIH